MPQRMQDSPDIFQFLLRLVRKCSSNLTDARDLNEIFFDTSQVFRFAFMTLSSYTPSAASLTT